MLKQCFLIVVLLFLCNSNRVAACSCANPGSALEEMKFASAVFVGKVTAITKLKYGKQAIFEVQKTWKGPNLSTIVVTTAKDSAACGNNFQVGETWLVFALRERDFSSNLCSLTSPIDYAQNNLTVLGQGRIPLSKTAQFVRVILPALFFTVVFWGVKKLKR